MKKRLLSLLLCAMCVLAANSEVQYILNEGFESGIPATWTQQVMSQNTQNWVAESANLTYPNGAFAGTTRVAMRNTTGTTMDYVTRLITPVLNLPYGSQYELKFAYASATNAGDVDSLTVLYSTDGTKWTKHTGFGAAQNQWTEVTLDLIGNGATYQLAFEAYDKQGRGVVLDAVRVMAKSDCMDVENFAADAHANSVDLSWTGDFGATFQLIVDTADHELAELDPAGQYLHYEETTNDMVSISGLLPEHTYYAYVRSICADNESGFTEWQAIAFTTAIGFPYHADFATAIPAGWQNLVGEIADAFNGTLPVENTAYAKWQYTSNTTVTGSAHVYAYATYTGNYPANWLVTPAIDIAGVDAATPIELTFRLSISSSSSSASDLTSTYQEASALHVLISTDGGQSWSEANDHVFPGTEYLSAVRRVRVNLNEFKGVASSVMVAFVMKTNTSSAYFHIDDVHFDTYDVECGDAANLKVSATDVEATATWTVNGKDSVVLQLSSAKSFATLLVNDTLTAQQFVFSNLTSNTTYYARVKQLCEDAEWIVRSFTTAQGVPFAPGTTGWSQLKGSSEQFFGDSCTNGSGWVTNTNVFPNHYKANLDNTNKYWLISSAVYLNPANMDHAKMSVDIAMTKYNSTDDYNMSSDDRFWIVISEDGGETWTRQNATLWSANPQDNPDHDINQIPHTGETVEMDMDAYIGKTIKVAFGIESLVDETNVDNDLHVANLTIASYDPNCMGIKSLMVEAADTAAVVRWTVGGVHSTLVHVSTKSTYKDTLFYDVVEGVDSLLLTDLTPGTVYYVRAFQNCGSYSATEGSLKMNFKTHCSGVEAIPYVLDFEHESTTKDPNCWTVVKESSTSPMAYKSATYAHGGQFSLYYGTKEAQSFSDAALPELAEPVNELEMTFWLRAMNAACTNTLEVGVMSNPNDASTFVRVASFKPTSTTYEQQTVSFNTYQGDGKYITFRNPATGKYGFAIDDINVHYLPSCHPMGDVTVNGVTSSGATLNFVATNATEYQVVVAKQSIDPNDLAAAGNKVVLVDTLDGSMGQIIINDDAKINGNTTYYVYVRGLCSETEAGAWSKEVSFKTECKPTTPEAFGVETFSDPAVMDCWNVGFTTPGSSSSSAKAQRANVTKFGNVIQLTKEAVNTTSTTYNDGAYAITPEFAVGDSINKFQISFSAATNNTSKTNQAKLTVAVVTSPSDLSTKEDIQTLTLPYAADSTQLKEFSVSLADYEGDWIGDMGHYIMFQSYAGDTLTNYVIIDNVHIERIASCPKVNEITLSNIATSTAHASWENTGAAEYEVLVSDIYTKRVDTIAAPAYRGIVSTNSADVDGLTAYSLYYIYVRGICAEGDTALWSGAQNFKTAVGVPYLEPFTTFSEGYPTNGWAGYRGGNFIGDTVSIEGLTENSSSINGWYLTTAPTSASMADLGARVEIYSTGYNAMLTSPQIMLDALQDETTGYQASFRVARLPWSSSSSSIGNATDHFFKLMVSEDGKNFLTAASWEVGKGDFNYNDITMSGLKGRVDLTAYAGKSVVLGFMTGTESSYSPDTYFWLDSISVYEYNTDCAGAARLAVTADGLSAHATWNINGAPDETVFQLSAAADFATLILNDTLTGAHELDLSDLAYNTTYYVRVKQNCDGSDWLVANFKTPLALPFVEDFEADPQPWSIYRGNLFTGASGSSANWNITSTEAGHSAAGFTSAHVTNNSYLYEYFDYDYYTSDIYLYRTTLVSPAVVINNTPGNSVLLSFKAAVTTSSTGSTAVTSTTGHYLHLGLSTDDGTTWTVLPGNLYDTLTNRVQDFEYDLTQYDGQTLRFAFYHGVDSTAGDEVYAYLHMDDIKLESVNLDCQAPKLTAGVEDAHFVAFSWNGADSLSYVVELAADRGFASVLASDTVQATEHTFTDLAAASAFYVRAKVLCGTDGESGWSSPLKINTLCDVLMLPWAEDFNSLAAGIPNCWDNSEGTTASDTYKWGYNANGVTGACVRFNSYSNSSGNTNVLATPELYINKAATLRFDVKNPSGGAYSVQIGRHGETARTTVVASIKTSNWETKEIDLLPYYGDTIAIYFNGTSNYGSGDAYLYLDNVEIEVISETRTVLEVHPTHVERTDFGVAWTVRDAEVCKHFEVVVATSALDTAALAAATKIIVEDTTIYEAHLMQRGVNYFVYVRSVCDGENGDWMFTTLKTHTLDEDHTIGNGTASANLVYTSWGNTVSQMIVTADELLASGLVAGEITGVSFNYTGTSSTYQKKQTVLLGTTTKSVYADYTDADFVVAGQTEYYGPELRSYQAGWVDYEFATSYVWDGQSNIVLTVVTSQPDGLTHSSSSGWTTAGTLLTDNRFIYRYKDNVAFDLSTISSASSGGCVATRPNVRFAQTMEACPAVENISHLRLGDGMHEARISWEAAAGDFANTYDLIYADSLITDWATAVPQFDSIARLDTVITGLTAYTDYYVYVRVNCDALGMQDGRSGWSEPHHFKTASACPVIDNLVLVQTGKNEAMAGWTADFADKNFAYVLADTVLTDAELEAATPVLTTDTIITLSNLNYATTYHLYVAHYCGEGDLSPYMSAEVTTSPFCQEVENLHVVSAGANTALVAWTPAMFADATEWEVSVDGIAHVDHVTEPQALIIGLEPETDYIVTVKAVCGEGQFSETTLDFSTARAQGDGTVVGNGTGSDYTVPFNLSYKNAWTQMIYPASRINEAGEIASIAYRVSAAASVAETTLNIYMGHTSMAYAQSTSDWVAMGELTLVASLPGYTHNTAVGEWEEFVLDTPFDYNGQDNLVIVTAATRADYSFSLKYYYGTGQSGVTLYRRDDYSASYAQHPGNASGTQSSYLPNVRLGFINNSCATAKSIRAEVTSDEATLTWMPGGAETAWVVLNSDTAMDATALLTAQPDTLSYQMSVSFKGLTPDHDYHFYIRSLCSDTEESDWKEFIYTTVPTCVAVDSLKAENVTFSTALLRWHTPNQAAGNFEVALGKSKGFNLAADSTYTILSAATDSLLVTNLESQTLYTFAVREICSVGDTSRWSAIASFKTECGSIKALPWVEDFENADMECWILDNGVSVTSTTYHLSGAKAMQFNKQNATILAILPEFAQSLSELEITYNWRCEGSGSSSSMGYLEAGYITDPTDATTFVQLQNHPQHVYEYEEVDVLFPTTVPAGARIAFRYSGQTSNWYVFVDDINVHVAPDCRKPTAVQVAAGLNDATISWNGSSDQYAIIVVNGSDTIANDTVSNATYTLMGLRSSTTYNMTVKLKSLCAGGEESVEISAPFTFATQCAQITEFPWNEDFNGLTSGIPACWDNTLGTTSDATNRFTFYSGAQSDSPCMRFNSYSNSSGKTNYLATPELVVDTALDLSFRYKDPTGGAFSVLASADNGQTFVTLLSGLQGQMDWTTKSVKLNQFLGQTIRIYFYAVSNYGSGDAYVYVDDVLVNTFNAQCQGVDSVKVTNVSLSGADVNFVYVGGNHDAYIEVAKDQTFTSMLVTDTIRNAESYHIVGLLPSSTYYVRIKQLCDEGETSAFCSSVSFTTNYGVRYAPVFASTTASTSEWKSASGTAEDVVTSGSDLSTLSGWSLTAANAATINDVHFKANIYGTSSKKWLVSPAIDLSPNATDGIILDFDAALTKYNNTTRPAGNMDDDRMVVLVCLDDTAWVKVAEWNNIGDGDYVYAEIDTVATHYQLNLSDFAGQKSVRIAFYGESTQSGDDNDLHVGNIVLDRKDAVNYIGDVCEGEDYDGTAEGNIFHITPAEYKVGENHYSKTVADTVYVLSLYVHAGAKYEYEATVCEGESYMDENFNLPSVTLQTNPEQKLKGRYQTAFGCDSTIILHLTINPIQRVTEQAQICPNDTLIWNGQAITEPGNYTFSTKSAVTGCDSIVTLAVKYGATITENRDTLLHTGETFTLSDGRVISEAGTYYEDLEPAEGECSHIIVWKVTYEETALEAVLDEEGVTKMVIDNHVVIIRNGVIYSVEGTRLN